MMIIGRTTLDKAEDLFKGAYSNYGAQGTMQNEEEQYDHSIPDDDVPVPGDEDSESN